MLRSKEKSEEEIIPVDDPNWPRDLDARLKRLGATSFEVKIVLGSTQLTLDELQALKPSSIVETDTVSGAQAIEILVNGAPFGQGEIVVIGDHLALRVTNLVKLETP